MDMQRRITLFQKEIAYAVKVSMRARRMRLSVYHDGKVVVIIPRRMDERMAERFIIRKSQWVLDKLKHFRRLPGRILVRSQRPRAFLRSRKEDFLKHKENARALAAERVTHFNAMYRFGLNKISIRDQRTLWGSCSKKGNLNFNYKIALLPSALADYIIVHELCHLGEFSHSQKFWNLVAQVVPDYAALRRELRKNTLLVS